MSETAKAYAVAPVPLPRKTAYSPRSTAWTLYDPADVTKKLKQRFPHLDIGADEVNALLEETGFVKAVKIREELIRWKERLRAEQVEIHQQYETLRKQMKQIGRRRSEVKEQLQNIRNILRLPRESDQ